MQYSINYSHHAGHYIIYPGFIYFITGDMYLWPLHHFAYPPPPISGNHQSVLWIYFLGFVCFLDSTKRSYSICLWFTSLSIMPSRSTHVVRNCKISFVFIAELAISSFVYVCDKLFVTPWTVACQAPLSVGFSRRECWSGVPFPPPLCMYTISLLSIQVLMDT